MLVIVAYDVNTESAAGQIRLRHVAKCCTDYGQRVQNSVFECLVDEAQYVLMKNQLMKIIDQNKDTLRFYNLGNNYENRIEHIGVKPSYPPEGVLMV